ncbi:ubiquitin-conjugating enzyme E2 U isoform X1 [Octopus bimaculoides]|uniref:UBC core domain-containing protein n=1 Tax=Octopus bimaculoides TaxID=37653 RepID=A0A0L8HPG9_OCTBM|nr:ubiquitin-conjugating enzyme E2 U isoform X1 [Octopus bimaculoides]XP_014770639.1 ubiquitin-conjugating enzyme E2 U isoform X1 [Octopus bimaculoides]|eukprot:XP_014770638.1 PREDICTED: ubiquitin-conjugating enzyme E2 U-like [Octopus bimaculoides]
MITSTVPKMLSSALLEKEFSAIQKFSTWGIEVSLISPDNIFDWVAKIKGLRSSLWNGGVFTLFLQFSPNKAIREPEISFCTIPFHPNVDPANGKVQLDFGLIEKKGLYVLNILLYVQNLLSNPVLENAVNSSAKQMLLYLPHAYKQIATDCVMNSQTIEGKHFNKIEVPTIKSENYLDKSKEKVNNKSYYTSAKISFEKYHLDWSNLATCKVTYKK